MGGGEGEYYFSPNFRSNQLLVTLKYWNTGAYVDLELDNIAVRGVPIVCSTVYINFIISYYSTLGSKYRPVVLNGMKINRLMAYKRLTVYVFQRTYTLLTIQRTFCWRIASLLTFQRTFCWRIAKLSTDYFVQMEYTKPRMEPHSL